MLEAALKIQHYTLGYNLEDFLADEKTKDAVIRNFEIIGEASVENLSANEIMFDCCFLVVSFDETTSRAIIEKYLRAD